MNAFVSFILVTFLCFGMVLFTSGYSRHGFSLFSLFKSIIVFAVSFLFWMLALEQLYLILVPSLDGVRPGDDSWNSLSRGLWCSIASLIVLGSSAETSKVSSTLFLTLLWAFVVYFPVFYVTQPGGFLEGIGFRDFAGGLYIHYISGVAALVVAVFKGRRLSFFHLRQASDNQSLLFGGFFIWLGWIGFNTAGAWDESLILSSAALNTVIGGLSGFLAWVFIEKLYPPKRYNLKGGVVGLITGLVSVTPFAGWVNLQTSLIIVVVSVFFAFYSLAAIEKIFKIDDEMKSFVSHGVPSLIGSLGFAIVSSDVSFVTFLFVFVAASLYTVTLTSMIFVIVNKLCGFRIDSATEESGPDLSVLGESIINIKT